MKEKEDIIDYGNGVSEFILSPSVSAILNEIDDGAQVFDETAAAPVSLPGKLKSYRGYVPWGADNTLPASGYEPKPAKKLPTRPLSISSSTIACRATFWSNRPT
jgi:hypothetical protein